MRAWRDSGHRHRFITVEFSPRFLRQLGLLRRRASSAGRRLRAGDPPRAGLGEIHRLTAAQEQRIAHLLNPPVLQGARPLWYQGKVLELMAEFFFERRGWIELDRSLLWITIAILARHNSGWMLAEKTPREEGAVIVVAGIGTQRRFLLLRSFGMTTKSKRRKADVGAQGLQGVLEADVSTALTLESRMRTCWPGRTVSDVSQRGRASPTFAETSSVLSQ